MPPYPPQRYDLNRLALTVAGLSQRRQAILAWVAHGASNREIADTLKLGIKTVEAEVTTILRILQVPSRVEAAVIWVLLVIVNRAPYPLGSPAATPAGAGPPDLEGFGSRFPNAQK